MKIEEAIKFAKYAPTLSKKPEVQEFYRMYEEALRAQAEAERNDPLTLDELRKMDGEPVYCLGMVEGLESAFGLVYMNSNYPHVRTHKGGSDGFFYFTTYGSAWLAYRRKPKEG